MKLKLFIIALGLLLLLGCNSSTGNAIAVNPVTEDPVAEDSRFRNF